MANVYFVRQGTGESATNSGRELPLSSIASAFAGGNLVWSQGPPCFGDLLPIIGVTLSGSEPIIGPLFRNIRHHAPNLKSTSCWMAHA